MDLSMAAGRPNLSYLNGVLLKGTLIKQIKKNLPELRLKGDIKI